jgi:uncharacterized protein (DUF58 family)
MSDLSTILPPELLDRVEGLSLIARKVVDGAMHGLHRSVIHGMSVEFAQHREYVPGDDLKHLDWKVLGRNDRYVIRQYQQETNLRSLVLVDCSGSMGYGGATPDRDVIPSVPARDLDRSAVRGRLRSLAGTLGMTVFGRSRRNDEDGMRCAVSPKQGDGGPVTPSPTKFQYAQTLAAALSHLLVQQGDSVGLMLASDRITRQLDPRAAPGQVVSICQLLLEAGPAGLTALPAVVDQLAGGLQRRSLVIVISDLLADAGTTLGALGRLIHAGHEAIVFQVLDRREIDFDFGAAGQGITVLKDMETKSEFEAEPRLIAHLVRKEVRKFLDELDAGARRHGLHLVRCMTDEPPAEVLAGYLHYRMQGKG